MAAAADVPVRTTRIVLTAAHCIFRADPEVLENGTDLDADDVDVVLGAPDPTTEHAMRLVFGGQATPGWKFWAATRCETFSRSSSDAKFLAATRNLSTSPIRFPAGRLT